MNRPPWSPPRFVTKWLFPEKKKNVVVIFPGKKKKKKNRKYVTSPSFFSPAPPRLSFVHQELGSYGNRVRTMHVGDAYENRIKLVSDRALQLLRLHASEDDVGTKREFLRFNLGSGLSWALKPNLSQASSKDGDVVVLYKGKFHVPPVHSAEAAHDAFVRCVVLSPRVFPRTIQSLDDIQSPCIFRVVFCFPTRTCLYRIPPSSPTPIASHPIPRAMMAMFAQGRGSRSVSESL